LDEAGISIQRIHFSDASEQNWHSILGETERQGTTARLIELVLRKYPDNPSVTAASQSYSSAGQAAPAQPTFQDVPLPPVDLAVVTAMPRELQPILDLPTAGHWKSRQINGFIHHFAEWACTGKVIRVVATSFWKYGADPTSVGVARIAQLHPRVLAMSGIAAGFVGKDGIKIGDILIAERAFNPREGKVKGDDFKADTHVFGPPPWLIQQLRDFAREVDAERATRDLALGASLTSAHVVPFASDAPILEVATPFEEPAKQLRNVAAYDLEAKSFFSAASEAGIPAFLVKSVCDAGKPPKSDEFQERAARAAAEWLFAFVSSSSRHWPIWN
jgi:nucleoside phosphorylase